MAPRVELAEVFPPGEFIQDELDARGWTQEDLATILGRPLPRVNEIIKAKTGITPKTAAALGEAFGTSAQFWLNLESRYRLSLVEPDEAVRKRALVYESAPVKDMIKRGWIKKTRSSDELEVELCRFFGIHALNELPKLAAAARASTSDEDGGMTSEQLAWCVRGRQLAQCQTVSRFSQRALASAIEDLRLLSAHPEEVRKVPRVLAAAGVRFVVVQHLPRTKIDGAVVWLSDRAPAILMSLRYDRIDNFWHTLMHELSHIRNRDGDRIDSDIAKAKHDEIEKRADQEAAATLISPQKLEGFIVRVGPRFSNQRIVQFARRMGVHPGVVAGQMQHRLGRYNAYRQMLVKVRDILISEAMTDGWGATPAT